MAHLAHEITRCPRCARYHTAELCLIVPCLGQRFTFVPRLAVNSSELRMYTPGTRTSALQSNNLILLDIIRFCCWFPYVVTSYTFGTFRKSFSNQIGLHLFCSAQYILFHNTSTYVNVFGSLTNTDILCTVTLLYFIIFFNCTKLVIRIVEFFNVFSLLNKIALRVDV